ncbi:unnamed protein product [Boreogadus saida]
MVSSRALLLGRLLVGPAAPGGFTAPWWVPAPGVLHPALGGASPLLHLPPCVAACRPGAPFFTCPLNTCLPCALRLHFNCPLGACPGGSPVLCLPTASRFTCPGGSCLLVLSTSIASSVSASSDKLSPSNSSPILRTPYALISICYSFRAP